MHRIAIVVAIMSIAGTAWGAGDTFALGNGHSGALNFNPGGATAGINTYASVNGAVAAGATTLTLTAFSSVGATFTGGGEPDGGGGAGAGTPGDLVLIWQTTGYAGTVTSGNQSAIDLSSDPTGQWELARVATYTAATKLLTLTNPLVNSYAAGSTQVVLVPEYTTVNVHANKTIVPTAWDGTKGGIVAFLATGAITLTGNIVGDALGGRGGVVNNAALNYCGCT